MHALIDLTPAPGELREQKPRRRQKPPPTVRLSDAWDASEILAITSLSGGGSIALLAFQIGAIHAATMDATVQAVKARLDDRHRVAGLLSVQEDPARAIAIEIVRKSAPVSIAQLEWSSFFRDALVTSTPDDPSPDARWAHEAITSLIRHGERDAPARSVAPDVRAKFETLARRWRDETMFTSNVHELVLNPNYQRIIALGTPAIPLLLEALPAEPTRWLWALKTIAGTDPADGETEPDRVVDAWLAWGRRHAFVPR
jgi:hypothetical protein